MTRDAESANKIINLIWTDQAAASVVGTKGVRGHRNEALDSIPILVRPTERQIRYRLLFAIPAILVLLVLMLITVFAFLTMIFYRQNLSNIRTQINKLSPGRIYTTMLHPELGGMTMSSHEWSREAGRTLIYVSGDYPYSDRSFNRPTVIGTEPQPSRGEFPNATENTVSGDAAKKDKSLGSLTSPPIPKSYADVMTRPST